MKELIIIGGGAAGMAAALAAAQAAPKLPIRVLEGQEKIGRKLLSTGNGRCNLTNLDIRPRFYHSASPGRLAHLLRDMTPERTMEFFRALGLYCTADDAGRVYPACRQASMVLEVLLLNLRRCPNVTLETNCRVRELAPGKKGVGVVTEDGRRFSAGAVVLTAGGMAAPKLGGSVSGTALAQSLGHSVAEQRPCLAPLKCRGGFFKALKGIRVLCTASLYRAGKRTAVEEGEIQFTDYGLSGIPALQFSARVEKGCQVGLDLLPGWSEEQLKGELERRVQAHPREALEDVLLGLVNRRLQYALLKELNLNPTGKAGGVKEHQLDKLVRGFKDWRMDVIGTLGWEQAQVTAGGVSLDEIQEDFSSVFEPRLFLAGEVLDAAGDCGGYNLHWAWCSGMEAGKSAGELLR